MLEVGNGKLTLSQNRFHMTLWAMLAAPLLAGNNLTVMSPEVAGVLMNRDVIAIDQDPAGHQGDRVFQEGPVSIWSRSLADGSTALAIFNTGEDIPRLNPRFVPAALQQIGIKGAPKAQDVWLQQATGPLDASFRPSLPRNSVILLKVSR